MAKEEATLGEILSASFNELKEKWKTFLGIIILLSFIPAIISFVVQIFWIKKFYGLGLNPNFSEIIAQFMTPQFYLLVVVGIIAFIIGILMQSSLIYNSLSKKKLMGVGESIAGGMKYFWKMFGLIILLAIIFSIPVSIIIGIVVFIGLNASTLNLTLILVATLFLFLIVVLYVIFAIYLMIKWIFSMYILIGENKGVVESFRMSSSLVKKRWWKTLAYLLILGLIIWGIQLLFLIPALIINMIISVLAFGSLDLASLNDLSNGLTNYALISMCVSFIFSLVSQIIITPLSVLYLKNQYLVWKGVKK